MCERRHWVNVHSRLQYSVSSACGVITVQAVLGGLRPSVFRLDQCAVCLSGRFNTTSRHVVSSAPRSVATRLANASDSVFTSHHVKVRRSQLCSNHVG